MHQRDALAFAAATSDYLHGLQSRNAKTLTDGDTQLQRSDRLVKQTSSRGDALYHRLGGAQAFGSRIDFNAYAQALKQAQQAAKP